MSPDRTCQPIEWHIWKQWSASRSVGLTDRTAVRSANLKGSTNHHTQTHPSHQRKKQSTWKNQPIEPAGRSNGCSNGLSNQSNSPLDRTAVRSIGLSDPVSFVYFFRVTHRCVIELFRLTYSQCSLQSTSITVSILDPFLLSALLGVTYVIYQIHKQHKLSER